MDHITTLHVLDRNRSFQSDSMILVVPKDLVIQNEYTVLIGQFLLSRRNFIGEWLWCSESNHFGV